MGIYLSKDGISYLWAKIKNKFYSKPSGGIPKSDLASSVQASLSKADSALQSHQDISTKQDKSTAVTHTANTAVGSATKPVYIAADGEATFITHSINADVPANAKFTDTTYSDATQSAHGLMTAADKKKLDGIDTSKYLPLAGGTMSGNIDMRTNKTEVLIGAHRSGNPYATAVCGGIYEPSGIFTDTLKNYRSFIGSYRNAAANTYYNLISVRHRNGYSDGDQFGMYIYSALTHGGSLFWNKQTAANTWQGERVLLDSTNYSSYALPLHGTADKANALATARTINGVAFDGTANITVPRSHRYVAAAWGTGGKTGFVKIATFKVNNPYANMPTIVRYRNRGTFPVYLIFRFKNQNTTDPDLDSFVQILELTNYNYMSAFLHKSATSTWDLYIAKSEQYDEAQILDCQTANHVTPAYTNVQADTLPSGAVTATVYTRAFTSSTVAAANALSTARTLTVGNTGKAFNGSANVSWSLDEIGVIGRTTVGKTYTFNSKSLTGDATSVLFNDYSSNQAGGGTYQSVFGTQCKAFNGNTIFATGWKNTVQGNQASGFGENNNVNGEASSSFGDSNSVTGIADVGFGQSNVLTGDFNAAFGRANTIGGTDNVTFGYGNKINGNKNFATGERNTIGANCTGGATIGNYNTCNNNAGLSGGWYSYVDANQGIAYGNHCRTSYQSSASFGAYNSYSKIGVQLTLGNGTESARANAFRAAADGVYSSGAYHTSGADYAEYFEWLDGNLDGEDRRGRFVKLDGEKILLAESIDDDILGIVSGNPSVVGDSYEDQWQGQYLTDIYGELLTEDYTDEDGTTRKVWVLNPDYDPEKVYVPRSERREWSAVGMMGKLIVIDDGTCRPNDYCAPTTGGIATRSEGRVGYRVLSRVDETHIRVLIKG